MARGSLNRRQAFAARPTAAGNRGTTAFRARPGKEPVLAFPADFRRLILAFHKILNNRVRSKNRSVREYQ
jgi:hypothetical protein